MDAKSRARLGKISDQRRSETVRTVRNGIMNLWHVLAV